MSFVTALLAARVWTSWIAYPILGLAVFTLIALAIGYVIKVIAPRYPKR